MPEGFIPFGRVWGVREFREVADCQGLPISPTFLLRVPSLAAKPCEHIVIS